MDSASTLSALQHAKQRLAEYKIKDVMLFDHKPILRIQVTNSEFEHILNMRTKLAEELKSIGFRFIAVDLENKIEV